jgi:hypothetical protein
MREPEKNCCFSRFRCNNGVAPAVHFICDMPVTSELSPFVGRFPGRSTRAIPSQRCGRRASGAGGSNERNACYNRHLDIIPYTNS